MKIGGEYHFRDIGSRQRSKNVRELRIGAARLFDDLHSMVEWIPPACSGSLKMEFV
jgi:hypothetical protein